MEITDELIDHIAHLSRLSFDGVERVNIKKDMENMISFMGQLSEIDTEGVEPLVFMSTEFNVLREDIPLTSMSHEEALLNAPKKDTDYFRIPKVLSK
ncbi:MAG: Asp-tRNA(Asn)/Glu-tRNA(Gln) amidotransferase subunit GatC [Crocinitomicaceae bacterium]|jgi:aspartyl-tRNA(Asn)/glutamyl-tRNA(Gln) amidotransferase subunit C|nr:Asp-tRNA(Asn)/Glu-tRNA(Gln) amidotransferase subunit GatC [Crocinitomicaceae bacterium]